tara:strand:- start:256 stop:756 length:501 start_codon:yes stop_codon:yes gene_type:complete
LQKKNAAKEELPQEQRWISAFVEARPSEDYPMHWYTEQYFFSGHKICDGSFLISNGEIRNHFEIRVWISAFRNPHFEIRTPKSALRYPHFDVRTSISASCRYFQDVQFLVSLVNHQNIANSIVKHDKHTFSPTESSDGKAIDRGTTSTRSSRRRGHRWGQGHRLGC